MENTAKAADVQTEGAFKETYASAELARALASVAPAMSEDTMQPLLNCVAIDGDYVVATDGHWLARFYLQRPSGSTTSALRIPAGVVKEIRKTLKNKTLRNSNSPVTIEEKANSIEVTTILGSASYICKNDEKFPPWRRIIPTELGTPCGAIGFSSYIMIDTAKAFEAAYVGKSSPAIRIRFTGTENPELCPVVMDSESCPGLFVVVMPARV